MKTEMNQTRCPCGGIVFADTEDWDIPLCYECFLAAEGLEQTELLKTTKGEQKWK